MKKQPTWWQRLLFLPLWLIALLAVASGVALTLIFVSGWEETPVAYAVYVLSAYVLTTLVIVCVRVLPSRYKTVKGRMYDNPLANRYLTDAAVRTHVSLWLSLGGNLVYAAINAISAFVYGTNWFGIFAVYYAIMAILRFLLLRYVGRHGVGTDRLAELRRSRACACLLLTVNLALSGAVLMMVYHRRGFDYQGMLIYVMALYAFWVTASAIVELVKYRKYNSPILSTAKTVKLAAAMMSMLSLETAMFAQFGGEMAEDQQRLMLMLTGGGIAAVVTVLSVFRIVTATKEIRTIKGENDRYG